MLYIQRRYLFTILTLLLSMEVAAQPTQFLNTPPLENESFQDYSFRMSAARSGISIAETKRRSELTGKIGNAEVLLSDDNPDTFAGFWIEETPKKFGLVVQFSGTPKKNMDAYLRKELAAITEVRFVTASLAELKKMQIKAVTDIKKAGNTLVESDIDIKNNRVELFVPAENQQRKMKVIDVIKKSKLKFPKKVVIFYVKSLSQLQATVAQGGRPLTPDCTTGFSVISTVAKPGIPVGTRGLTTAGHCPNALAYGVSDLIYVSGHDVASYDIQWLATPTVASIFSPIIYVPTNQIRYSFTGAITNITNTTPFAIQTIGTRVCKMGNTTGYTCGIIYRKNFLPAGHISDGVPTTHTASNFVRVAHIGTENLSSTGDSGGPWFKEGEGNAYGSHVGEPFASSIDPNKFDAFYMPIDRVAVVGVSVLTSP